MTKFNNEHLLRDIREFLDVSGMGATYFGYKACKNTTIVQRLESGQRVWPETEMKVRAFMSLHGLRPAEKWKRPRKSEALEQQDDKKETN